MSSDDTGTDDPVSINKPSSPRWSTSNLIASQICGITCHSSINLGTSPLSNILTFKSAISKLLFLVLGSAIYNTLFASCSAVVVFPHHLGPSTNTAPTSSSLYFNNLSAILFLYSFIAKDLLSLLQIYIFFLKLPNLAAFRYLIWRRFITQFGDAKYHISDFSAELTGFKHKYLRLTTSRYYLCKLKLSTISKQ